MCSVARAAASSFHCFCLIAACTPDCVVVGCCLCILLHSTGKNAVLQRIEANIADLGQEQYQGIDTKLRARHVECKALEIGCADLTRYCKTLEEALLKYHGQKMEHINQARCCNTTALLNA